MSNHAGAVQKLARSAYYSMRNGFAKNKTGATCDLEDLVQCGNIGLLKAVDRYDVNNKWNATFQTFAYTWIKAEIYYHMR